MSAIGDVPTAIIACVGIVLGVLAMARGRRGEPASPAPAQDAPVAARAPVTVSPVRDEPAAAAPAAVGHGPIRLVRPDEPPAAAPPAPGPPAAPAPEPPAAPAPEPPAEPPAAQEPATAFRQGRIRIGGLERGRRRDDDQ